jgi:hypothetical protein
MSGFHIHIDALALSDDFEKYLTKELGFWRSDFSGHPDGAKAYEPPNHLTQKVTTSKEFRVLFDEVVSYAKTQNAMKGYIEGEFIALDKNIRECSFDASVQPPFRVQTTFLLPGTFRESEIHITLSRDRSDPHLLRSLMEIGLFAAYLPKSYGTAEIFTVQGSKEQIRNILPPLMEYLERAGGAVECSIKEERVADWWLSEPALYLPPVVSNILLNTSP